MRLTVPIQAPRHGLGTELSLIFSTDLSGPQQPESLF